MDMPISTISTINQSIICPSMHFVREPTTTVNLFNLLKSVSPQMPLTMPHTMQQEFNASPMGNLSQQPLHILIAPETARKLVGALGHQKIENNNFGSTLTHNFIAKRRFGITKKVTSENKRLKVKKIII